MTDFRERYGPWALVAGASEGLGAAWAHEIAAHGVDVVLLARGREKLEAAATAVRDAHGVQVHTVQADLGRRDVLDTLVPALEGREIGLVVYNACYSKIGEFLDLSTEDHLATVDVNVRGPVLLAGHFAREMAARGRGGIVLMSSLSGFQGTAMVGIYAATKAFDTALAEVLWEELRPRGVDVLACVAGAVLTPNFVDQTPEAVRGGAFPSAPEDVVREGLAHLGRGPVWIAGRINRWVHLGLRHLLGRRAAVRFMSGNTRKIYDRSNG